MIQHCGFFLVLEILFELIGVLIRLAFLINWKLAVIKVISLLFIFFKNFLLDFVDLVLKFTLILLVYLFVEDFSIELSESFHVSSIKSVS